jgi:hypothetical protein
MIAYVMHSLKLIGLMIIQATTILVAYKFSPAMSCPWE